MRERVILLLQITMDWSKARVVISDRSDSLRRGVYISISQDAKLRCTREFVEKNDLLYGKIDAIVLYHTKGENALGIQFCRFRDHKWQGTRRLNRKNGGYELKIGSELTKIGFDAKAIRGKYEPSKEKVQNTWRFVIDFKKRLA